MVVSQGMVWVAGRSVSGELIMRVQTRAGIEAATRTVLATSMHGNSLVRQPHGWQARVVRGKRPNSNQITWAGWIRNRRISHRAPAHGGAVDKETLHI